MEAKYHQRTRIRKLSASTDGLPVKVVATATTGTTIHTATSSTAAGTFDLVTLFAVNTHTADVVLTVEFGGTSTDNNIVMTIPYKSGMFMICDRAAFAERKGHYGVCRNCERHHALWLGNTSE
jgi:hypothetical protein